MIAPRSTINASASSVTATQRRARPRALGGLKQGGILVPFVVLFIVLMISSPTFASRTNLINVFDQQSTILLVAAAGTFVLITGGIDLSVGAIYAMSGLVAVRLTAEMDPYLAMLVGVGLGLAIGVVSGLLVTIVGINGMIATLAVSYVVAGAATIVADGTVQIVEDPEFGRLGTSSVGVVPLTSIVTIFLVLGAWVLLSRTTYGRSVYAVGGNEEAARLSGIRTRAITLSTYALSGSAAGFAGVLAASRVGSGQADLGSQTSLLFAVLAGIVIGGTSLGGGEGAVWMTVLGVLFLALIHNGFILLGINSVYEPTVEGVLIVLAVGVDSLQRRRAR